MEWPFWFGFIVPFLALYIFDWIMFIVILVSIIKHKRHLDKNAQSKTDNKYLKDSFIIALSLAVVFGLGWGFGLLATSYPVEAITITLQVFFSIFVGVQGVLLFVLHGVRNSDARNTWKNWFTSFSTTTRLSYVITSTNKAPTKPSNFNPSQAGLDSSRTPPHKTDLSKNGRSVSDNDDIREEVKQDLSEQPTLNEEAAVRSDTSPYENIEMAKQDM